MPEELICPPIEKKRNKHEKNKDKTARQKKKTQRGRRNIDSDDPDADPVTIEKYLKQGIGENVKNIKGLLCLN